MNTIRRLLYRRGFRPTGRSIFYSPSLAWLYAVEDGCRAAQLDKDAER